MRALLLGYIEVTDRHQVSVSIGGIAAVLMLLCMAHAWGWL
jgi:hypothetical protein